MQPFRAPLSRLANEAMNHSLKPDRARTEREQSWQTYKLPELGDQSPLTRKDRLETHVHRWVQEPEILPLRLGDTQEANIETEEDTLARKSK